MTPRPSSAGAVDETLRSYKLRRGRMGATRQQALQAHRDRYAVPGGDGPLDLPALFGHGTPVVLEIGFGMGRTTLAMAAADPGTGVLAADVHTPGVAALLLGLHERGLGNVRVLEGDGHLLLQERVPPGSLAGVRVYFPDPWPKPRHHKRRLVDAGFAALVADRLAPGGLLHCATDWEPYAQRMRAVLDAEPGLVLEGYLGERPPWRPITPFEARGLERGHAVTDLLARRPGPPAR
ncbi:tRNA (guanosine(46)-N7)-methyltransferase TrmB [Paenibacillus sp. TRM 82003]|uniref:tRNA (guanosine(46)-N7)-methyltransferase TrmB n=1 Tax=Kineococcus sp. TRM81007 TaxID=2925831 RepID=UPI001F59725A|nr:tRNA (guanosine(46)-N7)-methyltransferase TrmB [Kineococcus sp. TRM81007]MCI2236932.1 tRNA (guanosine(46)-N7)-methyltransferase TrmB [Kineococcus sp. TRM81007]MCI3921924.1 tRNA (guanosine(46)-N7)-methyltransferase TrmB [Paenibacillus sp. TRM 82003]